MINATTSIPKQRNFVSVNNPNVRHFYSKADKPFRVTISGIYDEENKMWKLYSTVCSDKDRFSKKAGRKITMQRVENEADKYSTEYAGTFEDFTNICLLHESNLIAVMCLKNIEKLNITKNKLQLAVEKIEIKIKNCGVFI